MILYSLDCFLILFFSFSLPARSYLIFSLMLIFLSLFFFSFAKAAIKLDPSGSIVGSRPGSVWENLAATYLRLKQPINARDAYAAALELEPGSASLLDGLAKATAKGKSSASANKPPRRTAHV